MFKQIKVCSVYYQNVFILKEAFINRLCIYLKEAAKDLY